MNAQDQKAAREQARLEARWASAHENSPIVEQYLRSRGLSVTVPTLRCNPAEPYFDEDRNDLGNFPAMLARVETVDGELVALHRTYLDPKGGKLTEIDGLKVQSKKLTQAVRDGATRGAAIHLVDPKPGDALAITEGIETGLAVYEATGVAVWAAVSAGGMEAVRVPESVQVVELFCDNDRSRVGEMSAHKAAKRLRAEGKTVHVIVPPKPGQDWLDILVEEGPDALIEARAQATERARIYAASAISGPGWVAMALRGAPKAAREDTAARLIRYFVGKGLSDDVVIELLSGFAERCHPPMAMRDVHRIFEQVRPTKDRTPEVDHERRTTVEHVSVALSKALEAIQSPKSGTETPFTAVNRLLVGGMQKGELVYLGARPGAGKTAMSLEMARHAAKAGQRVLIVSREMLDVALARRMIAQEGKLPASQLKTGDVDIAEVSHVAARLSELPIWITDSARSLANIAEALDAVPGGIDLLIVDYLQLVQAPKAIRERRLQVESVSQGLKALALSRQIPILCLSSLSRPDKGTNPEPTLASLRESGELEHDADIVIFLHRPSPESNEVLLIVAKNRDGETGRVRLVFRPEWLSFAAMELRYSEEDERRFGT